MKIKIKHVSKQALSVILAIMMLVSTSLVGMLTTVAATVPADNSVGANETGYEFNQQYLYVDMSSAADKTLRGVNAYWDNTCTNHAYWFENSSDTTHISNMGGNVYRYDLSDIGSYTYLRGFKLATNTDTEFIMAVLDSNKTYNCIKVNAEATSGTWTTYSGSTGGDTDVDYTKWYINFETNNNWNSNYCFNSSSGKTIYGELEITDGITHKFGISDTSNYYKGDITITSSSPSNTLANNSGGDAQIEASVSGTYKFAFNTETLVLTVTYPDSGSTDGDTIIYVDANTYNALYVWAGDGDSKVEPNGAWNDGNSITSNPTQTINGTNYYVVTIAASKFGSNATFNMIGRNGNTSVTGDLTGFSVGKSYILKSDKTVEEYSSVEPADVTPTFVNGGTTDTKTTKSNTPLTLDVTAQLVGITNSAQYLTYSTTCTDSRITIIGETTANPVITAATAATDYSVTVKTVVTNTEDPTKTVTRTTTVKVSDTVPSVVYKVYNSDGTTIEMTERVEGSGIYYSATTIQGSSSDSTVGVFTIQKTDDTGTYYAHPNASGNAWINSGTPTVKVTSWDNNSTGVRFKNAYSDSRYIKFNSLTGVVSLVEVGVIYAKNGTIKGTAAYGTTVVTGDGLITKASSSGFDSTTKYNIIGDGNVLVTTTIGESYAGSYYIPAFVANGKSYTAQAGANNTYSAYIPVEVGSEAIEITPVYYLTDCKDKDKYIKFYVNANNLTGDYDWGNTIACYSYYYKNGTDNTGGTNVADGSYPGQPMLFDDTMNMYYALLPKTVDGHSISGITINNYKDDAVHATVSGQSDNRQSYDFNDMKYLADLQNDIIRLDVMPRSADNTNFSLNGAATITPANFDGKNYNKWDSFTDIAENDIDIYGAEVDDTAEVGLYIVSSGSYKVDGVGEWTTKWFVYDASTNKLITSGSPSDFIPRVQTDDDGNVLKDQTTGEVLLKDITDQSAALQALYSGTEKTYSGKKVLISYENARVIDGATRYDSRWYYKSSTSNSTVTVKYQTSDDNGATWTDAQADVANAYIEYNGTRYTELSVASGTTVTVSAKAPTGYIFDCFGTVDKNGENFVKLSDVGSTISPELSLNVNYVARFVKAEEGSLVISHDKYRGSDAKGGSGLYKIEASVLDSNGNVISTQAGSGTGANGQSVNFVVTSQNAIDGYKLQITLTTVTSGQNTFSSWYEATEEGIQPIDDPDGDMTCNGVAITDPKNLSGTLTYTFETELSKLFIGYELAVSELNFYSDIAPVTKDYTLTYIYYDRFGAEKTFVYKGTHQDTYYDENGSWVPNDALIKEHAPYIDDIYKDCIWEVENSSFDGTSVTLRANQETLKVYAVKIYDQLGTEYSYNLKFNDYVYENSDTQKFYEVPASIDDNGTTKAFQYWEVINTTNGSEVARCYSTKFNLRITCDCTITPIYSTEVTNDVAFISDAQYTREQYTQDGANYDYIYADFMVSYMQKEGILLNGSLAEGYQSGIIIDYDIAESKLLKENVDDATLTAEEKSTAEAALSTALTDDQILNFVSTKDTTGLDATRKLVNCKIDNSKYNNKNRLDYYVRFNNSSKAYTRYVYRAYYYVIDADGNITVSDPVCFYLYDIGNETYSFTD